MKLGTNSAIVLLFFGVALIEAIQLRNWLFALVFVALGLMAYKADNKKRK